MEITEIQFIASKNNLSAGFKDVVQGHALQKAWYVRLLCDILSQTFTKMLVLWQAINSWTSWFFLNICQFLI